MFCEIFVFMFEGGDSISFKVFVIVVYVYGIKVLFDIIFNLLKKMWDQVLKGNYYYFLNINI